MDKTPCLLADAAGGKERGGGRERVIYFSFFIQSPLKELFTNPKEDKRILKIEITCHCQFRLSEEFPNIPQFQLVETFFDEQLGNFDGCVHMLDSVFKGVGCSFILYRTINKNVYPNGSYDYRHYYNEIDRLRTDVVGGSGGGAGVNGGGESLHRALMAQSVGMSGEGHQTQQSDSVFSSFSVTNSTVSKMFRELENDLPAGWGSGDTSVSRVGYQQGAIKAGGGGGCSDVCGSEAITASRPESTSQDSLDSLEEFSRLEVAVDRLEDIVNDNYEFVIEEMFFEAVTTEVSSEVWRENLHRVGAQLLELVIREHVASCCLVSQSVSLLARSLVEPTTLLDQTCADCLNDNLTIVCNSAAPISTERYWGCGAADTCCDDFDYDDEEVAGKGNEELDAEEAAESTAYEGDSTMDVSESVFDRRWSAGGFSGGGAELGCASLWKNSRLPQPAADEPQQQMQQQRPPTRSRRTPKPTAAVAQAVAKSIEDLFNGWCVKITEQTCLETLVGLIARRLVVVLYKSSCSKSQFECRVVKALACFNQSLNQLASKPGNQLDLTSIVDSFFNYVVDTVMDPDALRMGHMSGVVAALQAPPTVAGAEQPGRNGGAAEDNENDGCGEDVSGGSFAGLLLLQTTRDAFVSAVRDRLASLGAKLQRKGGGSFGGSGSRRLWQIRGAQQAAVEVFEVAANSSSDELDSLPSESTTVEPRMREERLAKDLKEVPIRNPRACGGRLSHQQLLHQQKFRRRLERINEAIQQPLAVAAADWVEPLIEEALPLPPCTPCRPLRPLDSESTASSTSADVDTIEADWRSDCGSDIGDAATTVVRRPQAPNAVRACAFTVQLAAVDSNILVLWETPQGQRCEEHLLRSFSHVQLENCEAEKCLSLEFAMVGHASSMVPGRTVAGVKIALVTEAGESLHPCAAAEGRTLLAAATISAAEWPTDARVPEFLSVLVPAETPTLSSSLNEPRPLLHMAVVRYAVRLVDAAEQLARTVLCPSTPLGDCPIASLAPILITGLRRKAWTVHSGVRPSSSHCCPLYLLPPGTADGDQLADSHDLATPAAVLAMEPVGNTRLAAATEANARSPDFVYALRPCDAFINDCSARSSATTLRLCGVANLHTIQRTAASSRRTAAPDRALACASDRPAAGGDEHWPTRPVREWRWSQAAGQVRPALTAPVAAVAQAAQTARLGEFFDSGGCVGRLPAIPVDSMGLLAMDAGSGNLLTVALNCGVTECLPFVVPALTAAALVPAGRVAASEPPAVCQWCDMDAVDSNSNLANGSLVNPQILDEDAKSSVSNASQLVAIPPPAVRGVAISSPDNCPVLQQVAAGVGRSYSTSSLASKPCSIDDLLRSLSRQQNLLDRLYVEKCGSRRSLNRPLLADDFTS